MLGRHVTYPLLNAGFQVTIIVRDVQTTKRILVASIVKGDLHNMTTLHEAFAGLTYKAMKLTRLMRQRKFL